MVVLVLLEVVIMIVNGWVWLCCSWVRLVVRKCVLKFLNVVVGLWKSFRMWLFGVDRVCNGVGKLNVCVYSVGSVVVSVLSVKYGVSIVVVFCVRLFCVCYVCGVGCWVGMYSLLLGVSLVVMVWFSEVVGVV